MTEQRFILKEMPYDDFIINDTVEDKEIYNNGIVGLLNEQQSTITKLEQICETKMQEIEDIKYSLKEIAYKYRKEVQFKADTDPNQAVKEVLSEQQATIKRLQKHLDYEMEEHTEKIFEMLDFMKEKGVFDEYYKMKSRMLNPSKILDKSSSPKK